MLAVESPSGLNPVLSPDGLLVAYTVQGEGDSLSGASMVPSIGYVAEVEGGVPRRVCTGCFLYAILADNRRAVITAGKGTVRFLDLAIGQSEDVLSDGGGRITRPTVSPDQRWMAFRRVVDNAARVYVAPTAGASPAAAQPVDESTATGRPCGWSADSRELYLLLDTDGWRCLWGQRIDPATGELTGKPYVVRHFHDLLTAVGNLSTSPGNAVTTRGFFYETVATRASLWRLKPTSPR